MRRLQLLPYIFEACLHLLHLEGTLVCCEIVSCCHFSTSWHVGFTLRMRGGLPVSGPTNTTVYCQQRLTAGVICNYK